MMKKKLVTLFILAFFSVALALPVAAEYNFMKSSGLETTAASTGHLSQRLFGQDGSLESGLSSIISTVLSLLGIVFFALMVWSGLMWMTARGDAKRVDRAKDILIDSIIGIIIVSGAYAITYFILGGIQGATWADRIFSR